MGSYFASADDDKLRLDVRVADASSGETLAIDTENGSVRELPDLVARTGARLRERLGLPRLAGADESAVRASVPSDPEAARLYTEGLEKLRTFENTAARKLLEQAAKLEPEHPMIRSYLAEVRNREGYSMKARGRARGLRALSLSREDRLIVEGRYRYIANDQAHGIEAYRALDTEFPGRLDYGILLATAQVGAGKEGRARDAGSPGEATRTDERPDPRIELYIARAQDERGDYASRRDGHESLARAKGSG